MPTTEAQRTLVKSPPELWSELGDPVSLARHLGEVGEVRIARVEAETSIVWEAESARGTVELKPSGWGTKVTLTIAREAPALVAEPEPAVDVEPPAEASPAAEVELSTEPPPESEPTTPSAAGHRPRWFAQIFRRRRSRQPEPEPGVEIAVEPTADANPEPHTDADPRPQTSAERADRREPPDLAAELAAELARLEQDMAAQDAELLSTVLDRLGAAHHRPFSRG